MTVLMPSGVAKRLAFNLHAMSLSELPVSVFDFSMQSDVGSGNRQQFAVDMLYRCWKSSLVELFHDVVAENLQIQSIDEFVGRLSRAPLFEDVLSEDGVIWHAPQFETTATGKALLNRSFSQETDMDDPVKLLRFNIEACETFVEWGVPWQEHPLFTVRLNK